jgi:DNA-binding transcriptional LysR family regulator
MDWDRFRVLHAFTETGTLAQAARRLHVDTSTVSRWLQDLERELEAQLFVRTARGLVLTDAGKRAAECAERMRDSVDLLVGTVSGADARPEGVVRVSCAEAFSAVVVGALTGLHDRHRNLHVEITHGNDAADLRRRDADIAVRMFRDDHDGLTMRKLGTVGWSLYAAPSYVAVRGRPADLADLAGHDIVAYTDLAERTPGALWLASRVRSSRVVARAGSVRSVFESVQHGLGISALPCWMADGSGLERLTRDVVADTDVFAVYAPELKAVARVRTVVDHLIEAFRQRRAWLSGRLADT